MTPDYDPKELRPAYAEGEQPNGCYRFHSVTTPASDTRGSCGTLPVPLVVPIIFVPGIMGSNLKAEAAIKDAFGIPVVKAGATVWRVDGALGLANDWANAAPAQYQLLLQHKQVSVDDRGELPYNWETVQGIDRQERVRVNRTPLAKLHHDVARARGWGTVSCLFYSDFLDWLEYHLNSPDLTPNAPYQDNPELTSLKQVHVFNPHGVQPNKPGAPLQADDLNVLLKVHNPVYAFGYNWLQSNAVSGQALSERIDAIIAKHNDKMQHCEQVILITHSMGGLVARAACKLHGAESKEDCVKSKVAGVFHSVLPADGAAATYKRMLSGFGSETHTWNPSKYVKDSVGAAILGDRGIHTTPALSLNPGPLELLPNARYNGGKAWLYVKDSTGNTLVALPKEGGDPYREIYLDNKNWWRLLNIEWMNPAGLKEKDFFPRFKLLMGDAQGFHEDLKANGDFHDITHAHYGVDEVKNKAYASVTWTLSQPASIELNTTLVRKDLGDSDMKITLHHEASLSELHAELSDPDAGGDGTVPATASASALDAAVKEGHILSRDVNFSHDASYDVGGSSAGPKAALQAVVRILKNQVLA